MILVEIIILTIFFVIMLLSFGGIYTLIRNQSNKNIQKTFGKDNYVWFCFIGTPIHELCHWIACKIFRHKVTKVKLLSLKEWKKSGQLGCVEHSYNPKKIYQMAGNFIIGIAPIIGGIGISYLIMKICLNGGTFIPEIENISLTTIINSFKQMFVELIGVFSINNIKSPMFWLGLFVLANIFLHVSISKADLKNAAIGIIFFIILIPLFSILFSFTGIAPADFALWCFKVNFIFLFMLIYGLFIDILILLSSMLACKIKKTYYKNVKNLMIK